MKVVDDTHYEGKEREEHENDTAKFEWNRVDMNLLGARINNDSVITEYESKQGHYNYFYAHCPEGIYNVKTFKKITIKSIYSPVVF